MTLSRGRYTARKNRAEVLAESDICHLCGRPGATTVDHEPPRKILVMMGVADPDAKQYLRPAHLKCNQRRGTKPLGQAVAKLRPTRHTRVW